MSGAKKTYKVAEVCKLIDIQPYVLRYWETEFPALKSGDKGKGARAYSEDQLSVIRRIKALLYDEGHTIAGAKKKLAGELDGGLPAATVPPKAVAKSGATKKSAKQSGAGKGKSSLTSVPEDSPEDSMVDQEASTKVEALVQELSVKDQRLSEVGTHAEELLVEARELLARLES